MTMQHKAEKSSFKESINALNTNNLFRVCFIGMSVIMFFALIWEVVFLTYTDLQRTNPAPSITQPPEKTVIVKALNVRIQALENQVIKLSQASKAQLQLLENQAAKLNQASETQATKNTAPDLQERPHIHADSQQSDRSISVTAHDPENSGYTVHQWAASDTLWSIAKKYWHRGSYYPVLLETNKGLNIYNNRVGLNIRILKDIDAVKAILNRIIDTKDQQRYMHYLVQPLDNWAFILMRFYGHDADKNRFGFGAETLVPGKRISIALKE